MELLHKSFFDLLVVSLATWRISSMLTNEQGPFKVFQRLRDRLGFVHDEYGHVIARPDGNVLSCIWCTSFYVAMVLMFMADLVLMPFAISALSIAFHKLVN